MTLGNPWGLLALLAVPVVLYLHTFRRRLRERRAAGLFLFAPDALAEDAGRTRSPLLRTVSLWLELAASVLLAALLARPTLGAGPRAEHLVLVLDDTASMGASLGPGGSSSTVADAARSFAKDRIDALPAGARVTILLAGPRPETLAGPRAVLPEATHALASWRPDRTAADPGPTLDLALDLAGADGDVLFLTDEPEPDVPPRVEVAAFGAPRPNVAVSSAKRASSGGQEALYLDLAAFADAPVRTTVTVDAAEDGRPVARLASQEVTVDPARHARLTVDVPPGRALLVRLSPDALAIDDAALLFPDAVRVVPYAVLVSEPTARTLGLDRIERVVPGSRRTEPGAAALVLTDAPDAAASPPGATRLVIAPAGSERDDWLGPFLLDRAHGLVEGLTLAGVVWSAGREEIGGRGLVFAGDRALVSIAEDEDPAGGTLVRMNLDPARSTLAASPDWPIFLSNLVERARASLPGATATTVPIGEPLVYRTRATARETQTWRWVDPDGREEPVGGEGTLVHEPRHPGLHRLVDPSGEKARWSVVFGDPRESDLRQRGAARRPAKRERVAAGPSAVVEESASTLTLRLLALAVLVLAALDAWVLSRRRGPPVGARA